MLRLRIPRLYDFTSHMRVNPKSKELATLRIDFGGRDTEFLVPKMEVPS